MPTFLTTRLGQTEGKLIMKAAFRKTPVKAYLYELRDVHTIAALGGVFSRDELIRGESES